MNSSLRAVMAGVALLVASLQGWAAGNQGGWQTQFGQYPETWIQQFAPYGDGFVGIARPFLAVDGNGERTYHTLAFWDDGVWTTTGEDPNGFVTAVGLHFYTIEQFGQDICVGGEFNGLGPEEFNKLACWSVAQEAWYQPVGPNLGPTRTVTALSWDGASRLYVGGEFSEVWDHQGKVIPVSRVVATDGFAWEPLFHQGGLADGVIGTPSDIIPSLGGAYIAHRNSVSQWNPTTPDMTIIGAASSGIRDLEFYFTDLVAGGNFLSMDGVQVTRIAATSVSGDADWFPYGNGLIGPDSSGGVLGQAFGFLYANGAWPDLPGESRLARWTGQGWVTAETPSGWQVDQIERVGTSLCARLAGIPSNAELASAKVACQQSVDGPWQGVSQGLGDVLNSFDGSNVVGKYQGEIYAGGDFWSAGDAAKAKAIARWDGTRWHPVEGLSYSFAANQLQVTSMETYGGSLYVGGVFDQAGSEEANSLAHWNRSEWGGVPGIAGQVRTLKKHNGLLYIGGRNSCSNVEAICSWDGASLTNLGFGLGVVTMLESYREILVVAGNFVEINGSTANGIAGWDGTTWSEFAGGVFGPTGSFGDIKAMAANDTDLFITLGNVSGTVGPDRIPFDGVARWDGTQWTSLGDNLDQVSALETYQGKLYAAGRVALPDGNTTTTVARWTGSTWLPLAKSLRDKAIMESPARDLQFGSDGLMYVAGEFILAGEVWSTNIAALDVETFMATGFE